MFNRIALGISVIALVALAALTLYVPSPALQRLAPNVAQAAAPEAAPLQQAAVTDPNTGISITGQGTVNIKPNIGIATMGVDITATTLDQATSQASTKMQAVIDKIKSLGVDAKDIQTVNYSVYPITSQKGGTSDNTPPAITGYHVSNQVRVTVRKIDDLGKIMDSAVQAGANNIYGVSFSVDDMTPYQVQARAAAVKDAQDKAAQLAKTAGIQVGPILQITESSSNPRPLPAAADFRAASGAAVPLETGEMQVMVMVNVRFAIK